MYIGLCTELRFPNKLPPIEIQTMTQQQNNFLASSLRSRSTKSRRDAVRCILNCAAGVRVERYCSCPTCDIAEEINDLEIVFQ